MNRKELVWAHDRLARIYGPVRFRPGGDPLDQLVQTILSQNTSDSNSGRAWRNLKKTFPAWQEVLDAHVRKVRNSIRPGGLAGIKAPRIQNALRIIYEREGKLSLARLKKMSSAEVMEYLTGIPGVGAKTAACVLLFSMGRPVMPVDTHVHRVTKRLGWAPQDASPEEIGPMLEKHLPPERILPMHLYLVDHGRRYCRARNPLCAECPLALKCPKIF